MVPYIIKALQKYESVCVNDLGTFSIHYVPARIVKKEILPPHNDVTLDTNIDHDEIAFTNFVGMEKRCLLTKANHEIIQWVDELKTALENNKSISFDGFGTFSLNEKGKISFSCDYIPALNEEFEGMEKLTPGIALVVDVAEDTEAATPAVEPEPAVSTEPEEEPVIQRSTLLDEEVATPAVEPEPAVVTEPEEEPVIQRSTLLDEEVATPAVEPEPAVVTEPEEEPVIQRSTLLDEEVATPAVEPKPAVVTEPEEEPVIQRSTLLDEEVTTPAVEPEPAVVTEPEEEPVIQRSTLLEEEVVTPAVEPKPAVVAEPEEEPASKEVTDDNDEDRDDDDDDDEEDDDVIGKKSHWWIWLLIVLLLLAALGVCGYQFRDKLTPLYEQVKSKFSKTEEVVKPEQQPTDEATADYQESEAEPETVEEEPVPYAPEIIKSTADGKYEYIRFENGHFYVIAGSLPSETDAELHIRQRALDKYEPKLLLQDGVSNIRVCIGIFDTEEEAESYAKGINSKYWVLK